MKKTRLQIWTKNIWEDLFPETYAQLVYRSDGKTDVETSLKNIESEIENIYSVKLDKKPDAVNDLITNNKLNSVYIPDVILGQLQYGGAFNSSAVVTGSPHNELVGLNLNTINPSEIAGFYFIYQGPTENYFFQNRLYNIGDWAVCNGDSSDGVVWSKIDNTDAVTGIKGAAESVYRIGQVNITPEDVGSPTIAQHDAEVATRTSEIQRLEQIIRNDVKNISTIILEYAQSSTAERPDTWLPTEPTPIEGYYLHYRLTIVYTNAVPEYQYWYILNGKNGKDGERGKGYAYCSTAELNVTLATANSYVGISRNWTNITSFNGDVGDYIIIRAKLTDQGSSQGYWIINVETYSGTTIVGTAIQFVYGARGETGPAGPKGEDSNGSTQEYDLVIRTQEEFDDWVGTIVNKECIARSILFVGDGGDLKFSINRSLLLPDTLCRLDGINNAIIKFDTMMSQAIPADIGYASTPTDNLYSISNITIEISETSNSVSVRGAFRNCNNLINCTVVDNGRVGSNTSTRSGFANCTNLINCTYKRTIPESIATTMKVYGFDACTRLINCVVDIDAFTISTMSHGFNACQYLTNCYCATQSYNLNFRAFYSCTYLTNCIGIVEGTNAGSIFCFQGCKNLSNCAGKGAIGVGTSVVLFQTCSYINGCGPIDDSFTGKIWAGTNTYRDDDSCKLDA